MKVVIFGASLAGLLGCGSAPQNKNPKKQSNSVVFDPRGTEVIVPLNGNYGFLVGPYYNNKFAYEATGAYVNLPLNTKPPLSAGLWLEFKTRDPEVNSIVPVQDVKQLYESGGSWSATIIVASRTIA